MNFLLFTTFRFFPSQGEKIHIFFTDTVLPDELGKLDYVVSQLQQQVKLFQRRTTGTTVLILTSFDILD